MAVRLLRLLLLPLLPLLPCVSLNVLVVGGSGRVGGSTVRWLQKYSERQNLNLNVQVGCRRKSSYEQAVRKGVIPKDKHVKFIPMDLDGGDEALSQAIQDCGLVVHTAGPFQGRTDPALLRCCVNAGIPYVDVCDEYELAVTAKQQYSSLAQQNKVPAVVCAGIWPGVSALMAAEAKDKLKAAGADELESCEFSFFTAGTGNAGPTIVSATFLLLATPAMNFCNGLKQEKEPWTEPREVDFGTGVGVKPVWLLDNPDVPTTATSLQIPNVSSRFGTDPLPWNYLFGAMKAIPKKLLYNRQAMQAFALFSEPIIRLVDKLVGATNAMRVDVTSSSNSINDKPVTTTMSSLIVHPDLGECVGLATAAFCLEVLKGTVPPGIWYPAELLPQARTSILKAAKEDAISYQI